MEPKRLKAKKSMDFDQFICNVDVLLETVWGKEWGTFSIIKPTTSDSRNVPMPQVVYSLKDAQPGLVGNNTREVSPRQREVYKGPSQVTGKETMVRIMGRVMDCTVEFFVYADNNREAIELTRRLRQVLEQYKGLLMENGMQNMWFQKEYQRNTEENADEALASRGLIYLVRLEELFRTEEEEWNSIKVRVNLALDELGLNENLPSKKELENELVQTIITKKDNNLLL